jgi:glycosyltransferase involved in cell wall biosynthesis
LNILLLSSEFAPARGGIGTYALEIATAATALGATVTVVAPDYAQDTAADDRRLPFEVRRFSGGLHSARDLPNKIMLARREIGSRAFDVVHAADWPFFIPVALARGRTRARMLMTVHGTEINETQTALKRLAIQLSGVFGPRTEVAANSRFTRDLFRNKFAIDDKRIHAVRLGVSDFWFGAHNARPATRTLYDLAPDRIVMVTVARITRRKGHHLTLAALRLLPDELRRRITWLVIGPKGEADYVDEVRRLVTESDCDVRLLGSLSNEEIRDIYGAADFFCLTGLPESSGRVEGFGLVYLEAGATGLPGVASNIGGVPDAVLGDQSGLLVTPDAAAVAAAIRALGEDIELRARLSAGALAQARALSWKRCAAETYGLPHPAGTGDGSFATAPDASRAISA